MNCTLTDDADRIRAEIRAQRLNDDRIPAAGVAENVSPTAGLLDPIAAPPSDRRAASSVNDNTVALLEGCGQAGIAIAAGDDFRGGQDFSANARERLDRPVPVLQPREEDSGAINLLRQALERLFSKRSGVASRKFDGGSLP